MLARFELENPSELRADLQQYYGLNLDGMGKDYSYAHAAALVSQLPAGSRCLRVIDPNAGWTHQEHLLSLIEYDLRVLAWQKTKDGMENRNRPKPPISPGSREKPLEVTREQMEQVAKALNIDLGGD